MCYDKRVGVCVFVCYCVRWCVCPRAYLRNYTSKSSWNILCTFATVVARSCSSGIVNLWYVMYFRFYEWRSIGDTLKIKRQGHRRQMFIDDVCSRFIVNLEWNWNISYGTVAEKQIRIRNFEHVPLSRKFTGRLSCSESGRCDLEWCDDFLVQRRGAHVNGCRSDVWQTRPVTVWFSRHQLIDLSLLWVSPIVWSATEMTELTVILCDWPQHETINEQCFDGAGVWSVS